MSRFSNLYKGEPRAILRYRFVCWLFMSIFSDYFEIPLSESLVRQWAHIAQR